MTLGFDKPSAPPSFAMPRQIDSDAVKIVPSIAADFACLGEQVAEAKQAGADRIHVDVMDGHFVPNISMGAPIVQSLRRVTHLPLETALPKIRRVRQMIERVKPACDLAVDGGIDAATAAVQSRRAPIWWPDRPFSETAKVWPQPWTVCERAFIW